jgi:hypothetical protein
MQNDDIVARLQAHGQSLIEDSKPLRSTSTQGSSGSHLTSKSDEAPREEDRIGLAAADGSADMTPNTTIRAPELTSWASSREGTDSKHPSRQWEVMEGEGDEPKFGELKMTGTAGSTPSHSTASRALTEGSISGKSTKSSASTGELSMCLDSLYIYFDSSHRKRHLLQHYVHRKIIQERRLQDVLQILRSRLGLSVCGSGAPRPLSTYYTKC